MRQAEAAHVDRRHPLDLRNRDMVEREALRQAVADARARADAAAAAPAAPSTG
jgi:hypothetical protein